LQLSEGKDKEKIKISEDFGKKKPNLNRDGIWFKY